jgi:hypothetical protein
LARIVLLLVTQSLVLAVALWKADLRLVRPLCLPCVLNKGGAMALGQLAAHRLPHVKAWGPATAQQKDDEEEVKQVIVVGLLPRQCHLAAVGGANTHRPSGQQAVCAAKKSPRAATAMVPWASACKP